MRYRSLLLAVTLCGIVAAQAQTTTTSGMGATSPLGMSSDNSSAGSSSSGGIPLGATGINTPGVSPLIMPCPSASSNAAFDGGGSQSNNCGSSSSNNMAAAAQAAGAGSAGAGSTTAGMSSGVVGSNIPLGATDLGIPGESQATNVPAVTPCLQSMNPPQGSSSASSTVNGGC